MTYRELIELYKQGKLEEEKRREVEYDIEKQDAISEYLFDRDEMEVLELLTNEKGNSDPLKEEKSAQADKSESREFTKMINRSIRRAFIKMGVVVTALILIAVLFIQIGLPKLVSSYYYNPDKSIGKYTNQMSLDIAVYTELFVPGYRRDQVAVTDNGYGNYEFTIYQGWSGNGSFTDVSGRISRNKLIFYNSNIIKRPSVNVFEWANTDLNPSGSVTEQIKQMKEKYGEDDGEHFEYSVIPEEAEETIRNLDENKTYNAYISFDRIMDYEEFVSFIEKYDDLYEIWCASVVSDNKERLDVSDAGNIGFNYSNGGMHYIEWDREKYPNLQLWEEEGVVNDGLLKTEEAAIEHFTDMIRYLCEQSEFVKMIDDGCVSSDMAEYVEENGLKVYGFQTMAGKKDLQKLIGAEEVYTIDIEEIK